VAARLLKRKELPDEGFDLGLLRRTLESKKQKKHFLKRDFS